MKKAYNNKCPVCLHKTLDRGKNGEIVCSYCGRKWDDLIMLNQARRHILSGGRTGKDKQLLPFTHKVIVGVSGSGMGRGYNKNGKKKKGD